ncbi:DUF6578 domain-containing protein [Microbacterium sp. NPDC089189]|uniref:DUF6578 domain-containing protein n=1 Tax=Microbacterium sp. NPDC089189 TaxID=3154972 RepID=UPI003438B698
MTRVWLSTWEWACCGEPFAVGDHVDFGISSRELEDWFTQTLGAALSSTVDAVESHHEVEFTDRVSGIVTAVHAVSQGFVERRELRRPGHGAPRDAVAPAAGEEWPIVSTVGNGFMAVSRPSRYVTVSEPVPDSAELHEMQGVRRAGEKAVDESDDAPPADAEPPAEARTRSIAGWLVDVDEGAAAT